MKTEEEIQAVIDEAADLTAEGISNCQGMSYEEGVEYALRWVIEEGRDSPLDE